MHRTIEEYGMGIHENNVQKGFYDDEKNIGEMLMLIVTEVAEACEADRKDRYLKKDCKIEGVLGWTLNEDFVKHFEKNVKDTFEDELADIAIRLFDLAYFKGIKLERHIQAKMRYNETREHKHGGKKY